MAYSIDLTGRRVGRLSVMSGPHYRGRDRMWLCRCDCGVDKLVRGDHIRGQRITSCGCLKAEGASQRAWKMHLANTTHGMSKSRTLSIWRGIRQRCENPKSAYFSYYGGRGITVCERWRNFENFLADMGRVPEGLSLDRIDNNGSYCKENCRWATRQEQQNNRRTNRLLTHGGTTETVANWARKTGLTHKIISSRLDDGWSVERVLTTPIQRRGKHSRP